MKKEILEYVASQKVGVLAVEMPDGSPHGATLGFAFTEEPIKFLFQTSSSYKKAEPISIGKPVRASFVIGVDHKNMKTLQLDGAILLATGEAEEELKRVYFEKFPEKKDKSYGERQIYFSFTPTWWRFTDWTTPNGKEITLSTD